MSSTCEKFTTSSGEQGEAVDTLDCVGCESSSGDANGDGAGRTALADGDTRVSGTQRVRIAYIWTGSQPLGLWCCFPP